jgi:antitoxin VapB
MALNLKDPEVEKLAAEVAEMTGDSKTGAVREALREKRDRLELTRTSRRRRKPGEFRRFLETEIWPQIPEEQRGKPGMTKEEIDDLVEPGEH